MQVIEHVAGHYDVQEVEEFARVYMWHPEVVVAECKCGQKITLKRSEVIGSEVISCECGDSTATIREELVFQVLDEGDEAVHPWRYWHTSEDTGIPT